ncbi:MAG TPA: GntR family transcriptional regulator [Terriglobales bacterium]|nr:GntR family transcriptional regulator [Terriglobales bacterium]
MRLWISHTSDIPIREQLGTQIVLGIVSDDLKPGSRLPSTRELARRFRVHANTVSAAYRDLEQAGWLELRRGSGVYIRSKANGALSAELSLDHLIAELFRSARELQVPLSAVQARLRHWLELQPPDHFLLIEPDAELREIVAAEMRASVTFPVKVADLSACDDADALHACIPVALPSKVETVRKRLPAGTDLLPLRVRSVTDSLGSWLPARQDVLIAVVSSWPDFLKRAQTMLIAAGFDADALIVRDARLNGWQKALPQVTAIVCDTLTATKLPKSCNALPFPVLASSCLLELQQYEEFIRKPLS